MSVPRAADQPARRWGGVILLALAYGATGQLLHAVVPQDRLHLLFWPSAGLALGALVRFGARLWPGVLLGICLVEAGGPVAPAAVLALAVAGTSGTLVATWGLRRGGRIPQGLGRRQDVGRFVAWAMGGAAASAMLLLGAHLLLGELLPGWDLRQTASSWVGILVGTLVVAPPVLLLPRHPGVPAPDQLLEYFLLSGITLALGTLIFTAAEQHPVVFLALMPLLWAAVRFPGLGAAVQVLLLAAIATAGTLGGRGPFSPQATGDELLLLAIFLASSAMLHLVLAALIAERRASEVRALAGERRIRLAIEAGHLGTFEWHSRDRRLALDAPHLELWGFAPGEFDGSWAACARRIHPEDLPGLEAALVETHAEGTELQREFRLVRPDGSIRWIRSRGQRLIPAGSQPMIVGVVQDVTQEHVAAAEQRLTQARLQSVVDSALDAIITLDHAQRVLLFNRAAERMFQCPASEVIGQPIDRFLPPRARGIHAGLVQAFGASEASPRPLRADRPITALRADGEEFPIEASIARMEVEGEIIFGVAVRDLSDRRFQEQAREELERQLRQAQKMEAIGTLAGGIAHDFNNILGSILGNAELVAEDLPDGHPARESVRQIHQAGLRARDLVHSILTFSRQREPTRESLDLSRVVAESLTLLKASLPSTIAIQTPVLPGCPPVFADASQMVQVLMNLATNALHAMQPAGGTLEVGLGPGPASPAELPPGRYVHLWVRDTGRGMTPEVLERAFDPFFTTKPPDEGTGLGLAVVHGIIRAHGGTITARSGPGQGTRFDILLPAVAPAEPVAAASRDGPGGGAERIVLVDDEPALVTLGQRQLERLGYRVRAFTSPADALAGIAADPAAVDLLITDLTMPSMRGTDLARAVQSLRPDLPILLATGYGGAVTSEELQAAGVRDILAKPATREMLARSVRAALDGTSSGVLAGPGGSS